MYRSKSFYSSENTNSFLNNKKNEQQVSNILHRIIETIINKDQENFNKEIINLNKLKNKKLYDPVIKIISIIKNNFNEINIENIESSLTNEVINNNTDIKLEYLQYLISFDINESNGEFLEEKLEISRDILKNNNYKLKY